MTGVACSGNLGLSHGLLARLNPSSSAQTKLNLRGTTFVHPCGLVAVMCLAESALHLALERELIEHLTGGRGRCSCASSTTSGSSSP